MTLIASDSPSAVYTVRPSFDTAIPHGRLPTGIRPITTALLGVNDGHCVGVAVGDVDPLPSGDTARPTGFPADLRAKSSASPCANLVLDYDKVPPISAVRYAPSVGANAQRVDAHPQEIRDDLVCLASITDTLLLVFGVTYTHGRPARPRLLGFDADDELATIFRVAMSVAEVQLPSSFCRVEALPIGRDRKSLGCCRG